MGNSLKECFELYGSKLSEDEIKDVWSAVKKYKSMDETDQQSEAFAVHDQMRVLAKDKAYYEDQVRSDSRYVEPEVAPETSVGQAQEPPAGTGIDVKPEQVKVVEGPTEPRHAVFMRQMEGQYGVAPLLDMTDEERATEQEFKDTVASEIKERYQNDHGDKPVVMTNEKENLGVMISPSSKQPGKIQLTYWDKQGFSGDRTFDTEAEAILDAYDEHYRKPNPDLLDKLSTTDKFIKGNEAADRTEKWNREHAEKSKQGSPKDKPKSEPIPETPEVEAVEDGIIAEAEKRIDALMHAPVTPNGPVRFEFKTKTEKRDFSEGFMKGLEGKPSPKLHGVAQKYQDAASNGWASGRQFARKKGVEVPDFDKSQPKAEPVTPDVGNEIRPKSKDGELKTYKTLNSANAGISRAKAQNTHEVAKLGEGQYVGRSITPTAKLKSSGLSPEANLFNTDKTKFEGHAWRNMDLKELKQLTSGQRTYGGGKGKKVAPTPESATQYSDAKGNKYLVEFGGAGKTSGESVPNKLGKPHITNIKMLHKKEWIDADENGKPVFASYEKEGYKVNQVNHERYEIDISDDIKNGLYGEIDALAEGEPGRVVNKGDEDYDGTDNTLRTSSSYPGWFQDNEWTAKEGIVALNKALEGKPLGKRQSSMVEAALDWTNEKVRVAKAEEDARNAEDNKQDIEEARARGVQNANDEAAKRKDAGDESSVEEDSFFKGEELNAYEKAFMEGEPPPIEVEEQKQNEQPSLFDGQSLRFSKSTTKTPKGLPLKTVTNRVNLWIPYFKGLDVNVFVLPSQKNLGEKTLKRLKIDPQKERNRGLYIAGKGIYVFADGFNHIEEVDYTFFEEVLHRGIRKVIPKSVLTQIYKENKHDKNLQQIIESYNIDKTKPGWEVYATDEFIAKSLKYEMLTGKQALPKGTWQKIIVAVRKFLRKHGINISLNTDQIKDMVRRAMVEGRVDRVDGSLEESAEQLMEKAVASGAAFPYGEARKRANEIYKDISDKAKILSIIDGWQDNQGTFSPANPDIRKMVAFHGTPHTWQPEPGFPNGRMRLDKIFSKETVGEGGWAYGAGGYFAGLENLAEGYRDRLTKKFLVDDEVIEGDYDSIKAYLASKGVSDFIAHTFAWDIVNAGYLPLNSFEMIERSAKTSDSDKAKLKPIAENMEYLPKDWSVRVKGGLKTESEMTQEERRTYVGIKGRAYWYRNKENPLELVRDDYEKTISVQKENIEYRKKQGHENKELDSETSKIIKESEDALKVMDKYELYPYEPDSGSLYELDIPDSEIPKLLDWDKPLSEQPKILGMLQKGGWPIFNTKTDARVSSKVDRMGELSAKMREDGNLPQAEMTEWKKLKEFYDLDKKRMYPDSTGADAYRKVADSLGGDKAASEYLASIGIPGNTHGGVSKGATGAKYVLWDQAVLDRVALLKRNQKALKGIQDAQPDEWVRKDMGDPNEKATTAKYFGRDKKSLKQIKDNIWEAFKKNSETRLFDRFNPINTLGEKAYRLFRLTTGSMSTFERWLEDGMIKMTSAGVPVIDTKGEGVLPWFKELGPDAMRMLKWVAVKRAETLEADGRENWLTKDARDEILASMPDKPQNGGSWEALAKKFQTYNKNMLDYAEASGLIDKEARKGWEQDFYVPFYRMIEDGSDAFLSGPTKSRKHITSGIKRLTGREAKIGDLFENTLRNWSHMLQESSRNVATGAAYAGSNGVMSTMVDPTTNEVLPAIELMKKKDLIKILGANTEKKFAVKKTDSDRATKLFNTQAEAVDYKNGLGKGHIVEPRTTKSVIMTNASDHNILSYYEDGKQVHIKVNDIELFNAMTNSNALQMSATMNMMFGGPKRVLTYAATFGPAFRIANMVRDTAHTAVISPDFIPFWDTAIGFAKALRKDKDWRAFKTIAGQGASYIHSEDPKAMGHYVERVIKKDGTAKRILDPKRFLKILDWWESIGAASEDAARVQLYSKRMKKAKIEADKMGKVLDEGKAMFDAAFEARDLLDFTMRGDAKVVQFAIKALPFMNARMEGLYKLGKAAKANPKSFSVKMGILTMTALALWKIAQDDEDFEEHYGQLEDWEKRAYHNFWIGKYQFRIPRTFELGILPTVIESALDSMKGTDEPVQVFKTIASSAFDTLALNPIPQMARPAGEQWANKSFFTGRPIEGIGMQRLIPSQRKGSHTSVTLSAVLNNDLANKLGISPVRAESLINGYFSTIGMLVLGVSDYALQATGAFPDKPSAAIRDYPLFGRFIRNSENQQHSKHLTKLYSLTREMNEISSTISNYKAIGDYEKARELFKDKRGELRYRKSLNSVKSQVSKINRQIKRIMQSGRTPEEKRDMIDRLSKRKLDMVERAVKRIQK